MPARITVSVLSELLGRSQAVTDANRKKLLEREAEQRAREKQLAAKKAKQEEARRRRGPLDDPTGRNIFTAPAVLPNGVVVGWRTEEAEDFDFSPNGITRSLRYRVKLASADGLVVVEHEFVYDNPSDDVVPPGPWTYYTGVGTGQSFPVPAGLLFVAYVYELRTAANPDPAPGPTDFVGPEFNRIVASKAWIVRQRSVTEVSAVGVNMANRQTLAWEARKTNSFGQQFPDWVEEPQQGSILPTPDQIDGEDVSSVIGPQAYLVNDAYATATYADFPAFLARIEELRLSDLGGATFAENVPVRIAPGTALPTAAPLASAWDAIVGFDFGQPGYVALKSGQVQAPLPPPP